MGSTGYIPKMISREQPSSTGEIMSFTTGCAAEFRSGSLLDHKSGSTELIRSGGVIRNQNIAKSTAILASIAEGLTVISTTHVNTLPTPKLGMKREILFTQSTKAMKVSSGSTLIRINSTATPYRKVVSLTFATTKVAKIGHAVDFIGGSTVLWYMKTVNASTIRLTAFTLTSAT